ncbi:MAG: AAA family ATPase [Candidatus Omnitrophica bacterium]|nr:AAA family ATPase [Candidatus Omnitrophota bacterium]
MYFKKIELYGFKSFVDKTTLIFEPGVTAIVGPNGTGKSNISDAIKWVLGEQSAKSMRGSKMEDVIFNGTEARPPVNMCEVSLTLSNEDKLLAIEYDEVTITRRLYRSGESEYLLNKTLVRLKDIQELLMGTGIGTESYSLLEQGRIDAILSSKPEERRVVFEEASGITRYKKKKAEALRKLEATEENLLRVNDIVTEVNRQLNSIQRQVNKARRYQEQFEQLKTLDTQYTYREYSLLNSENCRLQEEADCHRSEQLELETNLSELTRSFAGLKNTLTQVEQDYSRLNNKTVNISTQIEKNTHRVNLNKERIEEFRQRADNLCLDIENANKKIAELEKQLAQLQIRMSSFQEEKKVKEHNLNQKQTDISEIQRLIKETQEAVDENRRAAVSLLSGHAQIKNELAKLSANIHNANARLTRLHQEKEKIDREREEINCALAQKLDELNLLRGRVSEEESKTLQLRSQYEELNRVVTKLVMETQNVKQALVASQSQFDMLEKISRAYEGFSSAVRALMLKKEEFPELFRGVHDVLVNLIEVEPGYEICVEAALAEYLQAVVVDSKQDAVRLQGFMSDNEISRVRFIALDSVPLTPPEPCPENALKKVTEVICCAKEYGHVLDYLLFNSFIVSDSFMSTEPLVPAVALADKRDVSFIYSAAAQTVEVVGDFNNWSAGEDSRLIRTDEQAWEKTIALLPGRYTYKFVIDGQWITDPANPFTETDVTGNVNSVIELSVLLPENMKAMQSACDVLPENRKLITQDGCVYSRAEIISKPAGEQVSSLIFQKAQMRQLKEECENLKNSITGYSQAEEEKRRQLMLLELELTQLHDVLHSEKIILANRDSEKAGIESTKKKLDDEAAIVALEIDETTLDAQELTAKEAEKKVRLEEIDRQACINEEAMAKGQELISIKTQEREDLLVVITEMKTEFSLINEQEEALQANLTIHKQNIGEQHNSVVEYMRRKDESNRRVEELTADVAVTEKETRTLEQEKEDTWSVLEGITLRRNELLAEFESIQHSVKEKENKINLIRNSVRDIDVRKVELNFKIEALINNMRQAYKIELPELSIEIPGAIDWQKQKEEIDVLKNKIDRIGAVNLAAVEEEEELKERADFLNSQKEDLINAKQSLMNAIQKINRTTKSLFLETFEKTKVTFKEYFKLLFGGGDAQLHLTEDKDVLESGIDIIVRPPGKKLQNITLLSGGERTLTAIALLFAIFKIKPTPFCVLDEMDAPLDESNISRFTRVLQEFLKNSQFIIITHNKKTISMADVMYGVTMEQAGVSKIVSVKFSDYREPEQPAQEEPAVSAAQPDSDELVQEDDANESAEKETYESIAI